MVALVVLPQQLRIQKAKWVARSTSLCSADVYNRSEIIPV